MSVCVLIWFKLITWGGVGEGGSIYLNAIKMSMIMHTAITPPRINESLLFLKLIF